MHSASKEKTSVVLSSHTVADLFYSTVREWKLTNEQLPKLRSFFEVLLTHALIFQQLNPMLTTDSQQMT
jgi:hypothetical protein